MFVACFIHKAPFAHGNYITSRTDSALEDCSPLVDDDPEVLLETIAPSVKKKKRKPKKKKPEAAVALLDAAPPPPLPAPPVLRISRNKHWKYISSYHVCSF